MNNDKELENDAWIYRAMTDPSLWMIDKYQTGRGTDELTIFTKNPWIDHAGLFITINKNKGELITGRWTFRGALFSYPNTKVPNILSTHTHRYYGKDPYAYGMNNLGIRALRATHVMHGASFSSYTTISNNVHK